MIRRPSRPSPSERERRYRGDSRDGCGRSAMQARNTPKPDRPPRNSRRASRRMSGIRRAGGRRGGAYRAPYRPFMPRPPLAPAPRRPRSAGAPCGRRGGEAIVVGHEDEGRPPITLEAKEQVHDLAAGGLVEVAGGLVGHQDRRIGCDGAGDGDALLLAARELCRIVMQRGRGLPPRVRRGRAHGRRPVRQFEGQATFSSAVMVGTRWKDWNTMPIRRPRKGRGHLRRGPRDPCPPRAPGPQSGRSKPAMTMSSVDLPEPDGPTSPPPPHAPHPARCHAGHARGPGRARG